MYAIYSMCAHPEYVEMLRFEASNVSDWDAEDIFKQMPFLDAFLRESARLNPLDACKYNLSYQPCQKLVN